MINEKEIAMLPDEVGEDGFKESNTLSAKYLAKKIEIRTNRLQARVEMIVHLVEEVQKEVEELENDISQL